MVIDTAADDEDEMLPSRAMLLLDCTIQMAGHVRLYRYYQWRWSVPKGVLVDPLLMELVRSSKNGSRRCDDATLDDENSACR